MPDAERVVTFEGATPAGGGKAVGELQVEDGNGNRALLVLNQPTKVSKAIADAAERVDHHNVKVESVKAHGAGQSGDGGDSS